MSSLVEQHFLRKTISDAASYIQSEQTEAIHRAVSGTATGHLLRNRFFNVNDMTIEYVHPVYERFLDMKKLQRNGSIMKRSPKRIHNRYMWGLYYRIRDKAMYGLTQDVRARIQDLMNTETK